MYAPRRSGFVLPSSQRGVTALMVAVLLGSMLSFMALVTDTGRLYFEKRSQQRNTDMAALEAALRYCRDNATDINEAAQTVLTRNSFAGDFSADGDSTVTATLIGSNGVRVIVTQDTAPGLFQRLMSLGDDTITLTTTAAAQACEPSAKLALGMDSIADVNLLNDVLGDFLGTSLAITVAGRDALLDTSINLLEFTNSLASLGITVGSDGVLSGSANVADVLDVAASVLNAAGGDSAIAASFLETEIIDLIVDNPAIDLGDLLKISSDNVEGALDVSLGVFDLVRSTIMLAGSQNNLVAEVPANLLGLSDVLIQLQVSEPPKIAVGNPELATADPFGSNAIYVKSAALRGYISLELPILGTLDALLSNPLISEITNTVNSLLSLDLVSVLGDILCLLGCVQEEDQIDINILSSPRIDIAIYGGQGEGRVTDYDCTDEATKSLTVDNSTSTLAVALGQFGSSEVEASAAVFSDDPLDVSPIPVLDIGTVHVRKTCTLLGICSYEYQQGAGWTSDPALADRNAFAGGGIGLSLDTDILGDGPNSLILDAPPASTTGCDNLIAQTGVEFCDVFNATDPISSLGSTLAGVDAEFYDPADDSLLGAVTSLLTSVVDPLLSQLQSVLSTTLSTALDPVINQLLDTLGVSLSNGSIGGELTCENDSVRLIE